MKCPLCNITLSEISDNNLYCDSGVMDHSIEINEDNSFQIAIWNNHPLNWLEITIYLGFDNEEYYIYFFDQRIKIATFNPEDYHLILERFVKIKSFT